jgi:hypothetical protein
MTLNVVYFGAPKDTAAYNCLNMLSSLYVSTMSGCFRWVLILTLVWLHCSMNEEITILTFKWQPLNRKIEDLPKMFPVSANTLVAPLDRDITELTICQRFKLESLVSQAIFNVKDSSDQVVITTSLGFGLMGSTGPVGLKNLIK